MWENIYCGINGWLPNYLAPEVIYFMNNRMGMDRCLWGTSGLPWKASPDQLDQIGLKEEPKRKVLKDNAARLFGL